MWTSVATRSRWSDEQPSQPVAERCKATADHPLTAAMIIIVAAMVIWAKRDSEMWSIMAKRLAAGAIEVGRASAPTLVSRAEASEVAGARLATYRDLHRTPGTPETLIARTLAIGPRPGLTPSEIREITGHRFAVRRILDAYPAFVRDADGRWHLGVPARFP